MIVGDKSGRITFFQRTPSSMLVKNQTEPAKKELSNLSLIVSSGGKRSIMFAQGNQIKGITGAGKEYFSCESDVAEPIRWVMKSGTNIIYTVGEYLFNIYEVRENKIEEVFSFLAPSEILSCINLQSQQDGPCLTVMTCKVIFLLLYTGWDQAKPLGQNCQDFG